MTSVLGAPKTELMNPGVGLEPAVKKKIESKLSPGLAENPKVKWDPLFLGGSDRDFYRVRCEGRSWIVMQYTDSREENGYYVEIAQFLKNIHVNVPAIVFHEADTRWIGLEDLGDTSLHQIFHESSDTAQIDDCYRKALDQAFILHQHDSSQEAKTMPGFDEKLYRWERQYFMDNFVRGWAKLDLDVSQLNELEAEGSKMAGELLLINRCLIHRDFQSQNLMVREGKVWLIDFQGMRLGHAAYDVASLLYDPYVALTPRQRSEYLQHYLSHPKEGVSKVLFEKHFYQAGVQRLMQALGAYGFLGLVKGKKHFLKHIPRGAEHLLEALQQLGSMPQTTALVRELVKKIQSSQSGN